MWVGWPLARVLYLFLAVAFLVVFVQVTLFHMRQNFYHPTQWFPVIVTPLLCLSALVVVWRDVALARAVLSALSIFGVGVGLVGTYFHFVGTGQRVGGYNLNNFMVGPPPMLPLIVVALCVLSLAALHGV